MFLWAGVGAIGEICDLGAPGSFDESTCGLWLLWNMQRGDWEDMASKLIDMRKAYSNIGLYFLESLKQIQTP